MRLYAAKGPNGWLAERTEVVSRSVDNYRTVDRFSGQLAWMRVTSRGEEKAYERHEWVPVHVIVTPHLDSLIRHIMQAKDTDGIRVEPIRIATIDIMVEGES